MSLRFSSSATVLLAAAGLFFSGGHSFADRAAADACAAKLNADAKVVYAAVIGSVRPGIDLAEVVKSKTRDLVLSGKLSRSNARPAAEAAGPCLKHAAQ